MTTYLSSFLRFLLLLFRRNYVKNMTPYLSSFHDTVPVIFSAYFLLRCIFVKNVPPYLALFRATVPGIFLRIFSLRCIFVKNVPPYLALFRTTVPGTIFNFFSVSFSLSETYCLLSYFFTSFTLNSVRCCAGAPLPLSFLSPFRPVFFFWSVMTGI